MVAPAPLPAGFNRLAFSKSHGAVRRAGRVAAAPIVAVITLGAGAGETGLLQTAQTLPFLILSIPAGVLADRMSRRRLMASAEAARALALIAVLALAQLGWLTLPLLGVLGFVGACGTVAYSVAAPALVPSLVPAEALPVANGRIELARTVAFASGPALAGALVAWTGGAPAFAVAAALSVWAVVLLAGLREPVRPARAGRRVLSELREGAAFVFGHPLLRPVFVTQLVFNTAFFMIQAVYVPYAVHRLGLSAFGVGVTLATYGIGMIVGALVAPRIIRALPFGVVVALGPIAGLVAALVMVLTIWVPAASLAALSFFLVGVGPIVWVISTATLRQTVTPRDLLGRASALSMTATGARPIGAALGAILGALYGAELCLIVAALGFAVQAAVILMSPVLKVERQPEMVG
jgi:predicted MFS family arabinose efflux permease